MDIATQYNFEEASISNGNLYNYAFNEYDAKLSSLTGPLPTVGNPGPNNNTPSISFNANQQQYITINPQTTTANGLSFSTWIYLSNSNSMFLPPSVIFDFINNQFNMDISMIIQNGLIVLFLYGYMQTPTNSTDRGYNSPVLLPGDVWSSCYSQSIFFPMELNYIANWFHITWTLANPYGWNIYVNGVLIATFSQAPYPASVLRQNMYIGRYCPNNPVYGSGQTIMFMDGSIADFRIYDSVLTQSDVTSIFTQSTKSPYSADILNKGISEMYTPIFCNIMPTDNNFNSCKNCNFGGDLRINKQSVSNGEDDCINNCKNNNMCTSYSYNTSTNNCKQYSDFPQQIFSGVSNINSGYNLGFPFSFNNLASSQQENIENKCALQYTNNIFTPTKEIDLGKCLSIVNEDGNYSYLNYNPECVFKIYQKNEIKTKVSELAPNYITNNEFIQSAGDPVIDKYKTKYESYITDKVQLSNINNVMSKSDNNFDQQYIDTVHDENNILGNEYLKSIKREMEPIINLSKKVTKKIHMQKILDEMIEGFDNNNNINIKHKFLRFIIFIVIILIIFVTIYNICK